MPYRNLFIVIISVLSSCASVPEPLRSVLPADITIAQAQFQTDSAINKTIRWGGIIYETKNFPDHSVLEVIAYPLDKSARPVIDRASLGRFLINTQTFLDPAIYSPEREVSVTALLTRFETRKIGEYEYRYPVVETAAVYLWPERLKPAPYYYDPWYPWSPWHPWYPPHRHIP